MSRFHTHVCLVSEQATPNLLPVLDDAWRPQRVVLATSAPMAARANAIGKLIKTRCPGVVVEMLDVPSAYDYASLEGLFLDFLANNDTPDVALNVTGGTKLMAMAGQDVFRSNGKPVFYVNVENDRILVLGQKGEETQLTAGLKVHEMLAVHGHDATVPSQPQVTAQERDLAARLIDRVQSDGWALGAVNAIAMEARRLNSLSVKLTRDQSDSKSISTLIELFADAKVLSLQGDSLRFKDEASRAFVNGGWLEMHVLRTLQDLRGRHKSISDVVSNVRVRFAQKTGDANNADMNEIDVAFLHKNSLHLLECKTANLALAGHGDADKATEALYKMESLLKLGGLRTKGMVVDYRGAFSSSAANLKRAAEANILVASGKDLKDLGGLIARKWLSN
jgi:hypothetical protein